jgi:AraC-like DNA-binding protein
MSIAGHFPMPELISLRTISAKGGDSFEWHSHPFEEFTLVTDDNCLIGYPPGWRPTTPNTLLHYRAGEKHGAATSLRERPRFWVVHYSAPDEAYGDLKCFAAADSTQRTWSLSREQSEMFQWLFLQLLNERSAARGHYPKAAAAWLQLLLVHVQRWAERSPPASSAIPTHASADVRRLWHAINESVGRANDELEQLYSAQNYDSVRHGFRKAFGCSPREMLLRLRMEHAKNLLLESSLSIKEISARVGYPQPHDFNRLFHRYAGVAPSQWRSNPMARSGLA